MQTFETFNVTEKNKFAMASALAMTDFTKCFESVLLVFGQSGVGKKHLLKDMEQEAVKQCSYPSAVCDRDAVYKRI